MTYTEHVGQVKEQRYRFTPAIGFSRTVESILRTGAIRSASRARSGQAEPPAPPLFHCTTECALPHGGAKKSLSQATR
jgi:hypothetical protein